MVLPSDGVASVAAAPPGACAPTHNEAESPRTAPRAEAFATRPLRAAANAARARTCIVIQLSFGERFSKCDRNCYGRACYIRKGKSKGEKRDRRPGPKSRTLQLRR